jgi:hypothetical protein
MLTTFRVLSFFCGGWQRPQVDFVPGIQISIQNVPDKRVKNRGFKKSFKSIDIYLAKSTFSYNFDTRSMLIA